MTRNASVSERFPQWIRLRTNDVDTPAGRYILAGGSTADWANYGRLLALRQFLATTPGAAIDVSDQRMLGSLARQLGMSARSCRSWLQALAECDAIDREMLEERGLVFDGDVYEAQLSYQSRCSTNAKNRARAARDVDESSNES